MENWHKYRALHETLEAAETNERDFLLSSIDLDTAYKGHLEEITLKYKRKGL